MEHITNEKEVLEYLNLPSIPKKLWDGKSSFAKGVAVVNTFDGTKAYAVAKYESQEDKEPRIVKVFGNARFSNVDEIFVVPSYMSTEKDINDMDLDDDSKKRADSILKEVAEIEGEHVEEDEFSKLPDWIFPNITNIEQAQAFIRNYRQRNKIKGKLPKSEEDIKTYLYVIYKNKSSKKKNK